MPQNQLDTLLTWLDPTHKPLLVQVPASEYARLIDLLGVAAISQRGSALSGYCSRSSNLIFRIGYCFQSL